MSVRKVPKDKPYRKRKEGDDMPTAQITSPGKRTPPLDRLYDFFFARDSKSSVAKQDQPPLDAVSQLEKDVIRDCKEMGMTDDEIQKWMKEL